MKTKDKVSEYCVENGWYFHPWHIDDVRDHMNRPDLDDDTCHEVLERCFDSHDCHMGMTVIDIEMVCKDMGIERGEYQDEL